MTTTQNQDVDDFLEHFGVKGMRWGVRRGGAETGGGAVAPTHKELRGMNKVARTRQKTDKKAESAANDKAILDARANRQQTKQTIKDAKTQYKTDKKMVGKVVAKEIMTQSREKPYADLMKAGELTKKEQQRAAVINVGMILLKVAMA